MVDSTRIAIVKSNEQIPMGGRRIRRVVRPSDNSGRGQYQTREGWERERTGQTAAQEQQQEQEQEQEQTAHGTLVASRVHVFSV